jgi:hypothetical protein
VNDNWGPATPSPPDEGDRALWRSLATMWDTRDPMPPGLVEQVLVALATDDLDEEYELLHLVTRSSELAGARGTGDALTISFAGETFSLLLRVSPADGTYRRVDGWVTPAQEMRVSVKQRGHTFEAEVDHRGRFEIPRLPGGPSRLWLVGRLAGTSGEEQELFATPTFNL